MTSSLLHQVKAHYNYYEYSSFFKPTAQNKFAFTPSKRANNYYEYSSFYKPVPWRWSKLEQDAFDNFKAALIRFYVTMILWLN